MAFAGRHQPGQRSEAFLLGKHRVSWEDYMETLVFEAPEDKSLFEAVMSLPAKYRTVIHLFYYEDYSVARIAEILHSREGTVKAS